MIKKTTCVESRVTDPYENLALEEYLLDHCEADECILYLWQNAHTVVIGKNQNAWKECQVSLLNEEGGRLARRISGGGAVYHDLGNLNFTFLAQKENYDVSRQMQVIKKALEKWGIFCEVSGRNDITVAGRKCSGNAFCERGSHCYHHGTLMVDVKKDRLSRYLTVSKEKLRSKGVDSVRSRVINLTEVCADLTIEGLKQSMREAFEDVYGQKAELRDPSHPKETEREERKRRRERLSSWDWLYGKNIAFERAFSHRFPWGSLTLEMNVKGGNVDEMAVYTDALSTGLADELTRRLKGTRYERDAMRGRLSAFEPEHAEDMRMMEDISAWISTLEL